MADLSNAEMYIMRQFWQYGAMTSTEITDRVAEKNWNRSSLYTFLSRLAAKGMIRVDNTEKSNTYVPLVTKEEFQAAQGHHFLDEFYDGSAKDFFVSMVSSRTLTDEDINDLREWFVEQGGSLDK